MKYEHQQVIVLFSQLVSFLFRRPARDVGILGRGAIVRLLLIVTVIAQCGATPIDTILARLSRDCIATVKYREA
jgi:hypothetical protein